MSRFDPADYEEPPEPTPWLDEAPEWWWDSNEVDADSYNWNEARYLDWCEEMFWVITPEREVERLMDQLGNCAQSIKESTSLSELRAKLISR